MQLDSKILKILTFCKINWIKCLQINNYFVPLHRQKEKAVVTNVSFGDRTGIKNKRNRNKYE